MHFTTKNHRSLTPRHKRAAQFAIEILRNRIFSTEQSLIVLRTTQKPNSIVNFTRLPLNMSDVETNAENPHEMQRHHLTKFIPSFSHIYDSLSITMQNSSNPHAAH